MVMHVPVIIEEHPLVKGPREAWSDPKYVVKVGQEQVNRLNALLEKLSEIEFKCPPNEPICRELSTIINELSRVHLTLAEVMYRLEPVVKKL